MRDKECEYCRVIYTPTGPAQKACAVCSNHAENVNQQVKRDIIRFEKFGTYERIGQGMMTKTGTESLLYKDGIGIFHKVLSPAVKTRRYCEYCGKDLKDANRYEWCAHHKDFDRTNNTIDNIALSCKSCHQVMHNCIDNLPRKSNDYPERE